MRREIEECERDPVTYFTRYCTLEVANADREKDAMRGILLGIKSALNNILAVDGQDNRVLWLVHNRLKHGFMVLDKVERESVVFYMLVNGNPDNKTDRKEVPVELKINDAKAKQWLDTIHAMSNTQQNISHLIGNFRLEQEDEPNDR